MVIFLQSTNYIFLVKLNKWFLGFEADEKILHKLYILLIYLQYYLYSIFVNVNEEKVDKEKDFYSLV